MADVGDSIQMKANLHVEAKGDTQLKIHAMEPCLQARPQDLCNTDDHLRASPSVVALPATTRELQEDRRLWNEFVGTRAPQPRERLIERNLPLVKLVARRMHVHLPPIWDWNDLIAYGTVGLIEAIDRFDPAQGRSFASYAAYRVHGSIVDALRTSSGMSRTVMAKARVLRATIEELQQQLSGQPTDTEIAAALGVSIATLKKLQARMSIRLISLDSPAAGQDNADIVVADALEDRASPSPQEYMESAEVRRTLYAAIKHLPERERRVLALYYPDGGRQPTFREIGGVLGISQARVYQIYVRAVVRLRQAIQARLSG